MEVIRHISRRRSQTQMEGGGRMAKHLHLALVTRMAKHLQLVIVGHLRRCPRMLATVLHLALMGRRMTLTMPATPHHIIWATMGATRLRRI